MQYLRSALGLLAALAGGGAVGWLAGGAVLAHLTLPIEQVEKTVLRLFAVAGLLAAGTVYVAAVRTRQS